MANFLDMAKKAANKISDEINKNKWDSNSINSALFTSDSERNNVPPNPASMRPAFAQPAPTPAVGNSAPAGTPAPVPVTQPVPAPAAQPAPVPVSASSTAPGYTKPVFRSRFAGPMHSNSRPAQPTGSGLGGIDSLPTVDQSQKISNIGKSPEELQAEAAAAQPTPVPVSAAIPAPMPAPVAAVQAASDAAFCYYVHITHTKTEPSVGKRVMIRSCDSEYVWMDDQGEERKPSCEICPKCGKKVSITSIEMD